MHTYLSVNDQRFVCIVQIKRRASFMHGIACVFERKSHLFIGQADILQQAIKAELLDRKFPRKSQENRESTSPSQYWASVLLYTALLKRDTDNWTNTQTFYTYCSYCNLQNLSLHKTNIHFDILVKTMSLYGFINLLA